MKSFYCECCEKGYNFGETSFNNYFKQTSSNQKYFKLRNRCQGYNSYAFLKAILHECQRSSKFKYLDRSFAYSI